MTRIAVIPARGGSKRIPGKNIRNFSGIPAIGYAIKAAIESECFDDILISTDSDKIASTARELGTVTPLKRSEYLAGDNVPTVPVIADAIREYVGLGSTENLDVCCIYPVNPFIDSEAIKAGWDMLKTNPNVSYINPICSYQYPIQRSLRIVDGRISMVNEEYSLTRSQDLEERYHDAGQWYWGKANTWLNQEPLLNNSIGLQIPRWMCQDIDTDEDWISAEILYEVWQFRRYQEKNPCEM